MNDIVYRLRAAENWAMDGVEIFVFRSDREGRERQVMVDMTFMSAPPEQVPPGEAQSILISEKAAQDLMSRLWSMGIRPEGVKDPSGEINAHKLHIANLEKVLHTFLEMVSRHKGGL